MAAEDTIRKIGEAINARDLDAFAQQCARDTVVHGPGRPEPLRGREAVRKDVREFLTAFPDLEGLTLNVIDRR